MSQRKYVTHQILYYLHSTISLISFNCQPPPKQKSSKAFSPDTSITPDSLSPPFLTKGQVVCIHLIPQNQRETFKEKVPCCPTACHQTERNGQTRPLFYYYLRTPKKLGDLFAKEQKVGSKRHLNSTLFHYITYSFSRFPIL